MTYVLVVVLVSGYVKSITQVGAFADLSACEAAKVELSATVKEGFDPGYFKATCLKLGSK